VNDNQPKDLLKNQIMKCIICHSDTTPPKIMAMCTRCKKGFIAYHKFNGATTMKKHVESNHFSLLKILLEDVASLLDHEPNKKNAHVSPTIVFSFFLLILISRRMM